MHLAYYSNKAKLQSERKAGKIGMINSDKIWSNWNVIKLKDNVLTSLTI